MAYFSQDDENGAKGIAPGDTTDKDEVQLDTAAPIIETLSYIIRHREEGRTIPESVSVALKGAMSDMFATVMLNDDINDATYIQARFLTSHRDALTIAEDGAGLREFISDRYGASSLNKFDDSFLKFVRHTFPAVGEFLNSVEDQVESNNDNSTTHPEMIIKNILQGRMQESALVKVIRKESDLATKLNIGFVIASLTRLLLFNRKAGTWAVMRLLSSSKNSDIIADMDDDHLVELCNRLAPSRGKNEATPHKRLFKKMILSNVSDVRNFVQALGHHVVSVKKLIIN